MSYAHLIFGIVLFVIFLITGRLMRADFPDKDIIPQEFRLLMRSRHIYILFSSLIHILLGLYLRMHENAWRKTLQIFGSTLLFLASLLLVWAFIFETYAAKHFSDISRYGLYASLAGAVFHLLSQNRIPK